MTTAKGCFREDHVDSTEERSSTWKPQSKAIAKESRCGQRPQALDLEVLSVQVERELDAGFYEAMSVVFGEFHV